MSAIGYPRRMRGSPCEFRHHERGEQQRHDDGQLGGQRLDIEIAIQAVEAGIHGALESERQDDERDELVGRDPEIVEGNPHEQHGAQAMAQVDGEIGEEVFHGLRSSADAIA